MSDELQNCDGLALADLVRKGQVTSRELVEDAIRRITVHDPKVNSVVVKLYEDARAQASQPLASGPFTGVPFLQKDMYEAVAGVPMSCGTRAMNRIVQTRDSERTLRYRRAGLVLLGKTNLPELSLSASTGCDLFGETRNPWDLTRTPGGSSGGSAAAVAARFVPIATGEDGGGSLRIPASCCGVFSLKPSRGRTPEGPDAGDVWRGFAQGGVITRSVRDSAAMLDVLIGREPGSPYMYSAPERPFLQEVSAEPGALRIAFTSKPLLGHEVHPDCVAALESTTALLDELGHEVREANPPVDRDRFALAFTMLVAAETAAELASIGRVFGDKVSYSDFEPKTVGLALLGKSFRADEYAEALNYMTSASRAIGHFFETYDILLTPVLPDPPPRIGFDRPTAMEEMLISLVSKLRAPRLLKMLNVAERLAGTTFDFMANTPVFNATGQPAMSVPLYWNDMGLPIGMQFVGRMGEEATLFRLAGQMERARPWVDRLPPLLS